MKPSSGKKNTQKKTGRCLVVGAGVSGIRCALDLAQLGCQVLLIDKSHHSGGLLSKLDTQFPSDGCGFCRGLPFFERDQCSQHCLRKGFFHKNITTLLSTRLISIEGEAGNFSVILKQSPAQINPERCIGCGECARVCPVEVPDAFNENLTLRKAVYLPTPQSPANAWTIDPAFCTRCGECENICPTGAVHITGQDREQFRILVVDDEKIVRDSMGEWLKQEGFSVATAESGTKALDIMDEAQSENRQFHMMLTDIKMPGMDGVQLLAHAKERNPDIAVIMMTAYAAVESAVDAMKQGALDYLTKPFDPEALIAMTVEIFQDWETAEGQKKTVDTIIFSSGADFFNPAAGKNPYGYGVLPGVLSQLEMERLISPAGPGRGEILHPVSKKPVKKIAWFQCVGSRDTQENAPFCSSACCMISIKQACRVQKICAAGGATVETTIFYMDMRTCGKSFEQYRLKAENDSKVTFIQSRVHSLQTAKQDAARLLARYADDTGMAQEDEFDLVVLAIGNRQDKQLRIIAEKNEIDVNSWGFIASLPFLPAQTSKEGIFAAGNTTGPKDIHESVITASAAAMQAGRLMHTLGRPPWGPDGLNGVETENPLTFPNPRTAVVLYPEKDTPFKDGAAAALKTAFKHMPDIACVEITPPDRDDNDPDSGLSFLTDLQDKTGFNRLVLGTCFPSTGRFQRSTLEKATLIAGTMIEILDLNTVSGWESASPTLMRALKILVSRLNFKNPAPSRRLAAPSPDSSRGALVVGGGIAGITAALCLGESGFHVDLVEKTRDLGGNLLWMDRTIQGHDITGFLADQIKRLESCETIHIHKETVVDGAIRYPGGFTSFLSPAAQNEDRPDQSQTIHHGVTILATGGSEAAPAGRFNSGSDKTDAPLTDGPLFSQKGFAQALDEGKINTGNLNTVVMLQCAGTRSRESNPYCSRVCCIHALKTALELIDRHPDIQIFILYRDLMSFGFYEDYYTQARNAGVIFIRFDPKDPPRTDITSDGVQVIVRDHVLNQPVQLEADILIRASGIDPQLSFDLAEAYGAGLDNQGFFLEADYKFRPVESTDYRVFSCGLSLASCLIEEAVASAQAAAVRALQVLKEDFPRSGTVVASTRKAICAMCGACVDACPFGARFMDEPENKIVVDPAACQGCGACAAVCPSGAAVLEGLDARHMLDVIDINLS